ncbi:MAPEG family protein, partial [Kangiella sp.]|uniref:MAPEG family protein n=1 Tax=Kangiella sp. TaxID=1920245 RepID=UPI003A91816D
ENVPFALLLLWMYESLSGAPILVHLMGVLLCIGRLIHAYGVSQEKEPLIYRQGGMMMTFLVMLIAALLILTNLALGYRF